MNHSQQATNGEAFNDDQRHFLEGLFSGLRQRGISFAAAMPGAGPAPLAGSGDSADERLTKEERIKRELHPLDAFPRLHQNARQDEGPEGGDLFRFKWNGVFWLAPVHEGYMCRLRIPAGRLTTTQLAGLANAADELASGFLQFTTRNNIQLRVIAPGNAPAMLRRVQDLGLHSRGSGGDNLRNITASPTAGFDARELVDVTPHALDFAHLVINTPAFYDLPRKFNVAFDGGGEVSIASDTNDIGFQAVRLGPGAADGEPPAGTYYRILLGGVTGHRRFAECGGALCQPEQAAEVAAAVVRVFLRHGDRSNRRKARMVYVLDKLGFDRVLEETSMELGAPLLRLSAGRLEQRIESTGAPRPSQSHLGIHGQRESGLFWLGIHVPGGLMESGQARDLAALAAEFGTGDLRLTVFQTLILPHVPEDRLHDCVAALRAIGLDVGASAVRGGLVACTGSRWCKYAAADTKGDSLALADFLDARIRLDEPLNLHFTGCPHSCAQHFIGDIGFLACKVETDEGKRPGYHVFVGGGFGDHRAIGRQLAASVPAGEPLHVLILGLLHGYLRERREGESFQAFTNRLDTDALLALAREPAPAAVDHTSPPFPGHTEPVGARLSMIA